MSSKRVAVVGAGLSGASCANRLSKTYNFSVKLFDKSRGTGGRMATRRGTRPDGAAMQCDHGAQYFTARSQEFKTQVQDWVKANAVDIWDSKPAVYDGNTWQECTSASHVDRWVGIPSMKAPIRLLLEDADVELNSTIREISKNSNGQWHLHSEENGWSVEAFDAVVFAVPAPQVTPLIVDHSPLLSTISENTLMKGTWALMLQYAQPLNVPFDSAFINDGPLSWVSRDNSKPGRNESVETWLLHATSAWSHANIEEPAEAVASDLIAAFTSLNMPHGYDPIAAPDSWSIHRWRYATTHPNLDIDSRWDQQAKIGMCGDWLSVGKIEGAWLSGRHLADSIHDSLGTCSHDNTEDNAQLAQSSKL